MTVLTKQIKIILNCVQSCKIPAAAKAVLKEEDEAGHITLSSSKTLNKMTVTKTQGTAARGIRGTDQWGGRKGVFVTN